MSGLVEFLEARVAEDEVIARDFVPEEIEHPSIERQRYIREWHEWVTLYDPVRALAECEAKRRIIELHKSWPVLIESPPKFEPASSDDVNSMTFRMSKQIAWATEDEYRKRFGSEPPTAPMLRALAEVYADHPDYDEGWRP